MKNKTISTTWITVASVLIPLAVALLFKVKVHGHDFSFLPHVYASINALTFCFLWVAFYSIKKGNVNAHRKWMMTNLFLSLLFLVLYVLYHATSETTMYGGSGILRTVYYFLLITHIVLSVVIVPLVLWSLKFALEGNFVRHKKWVAFAFPIWLYVTFSGVFVYLLIRPYYG